MHKIETIENTNGSDSTMVADTQPGLQERKFI